MPQQGQFALLRQRRFAPFFWTQFLGALNDNIYKNALIIMLAFQVSSLSAQDTNALINLSAGLFILPFFLFSATSGQIADKYEKSRLIQYTVLLELALMSLGAFGFYFQHVPLLMFTLFLGGVQSAAFGPVKYAILPQHLKPEELIGGNGLVEMGTFVAILLGTLLGGVLIGIERFGSTLVSATTVGLSLTGYLMSRLIPDSPAPAPALRINWNPLSETWRNLRFTRRNRTVFLSILGISWFWFYGATYLAQLPSYSKEVLRGDESLVTLLLTLFSVGIGTGSLLCERLSGRRIELGLVPLGSIGLSAFAIDLYFAARHLAPSHDWLGFLGQPGAWRLVIDLLALGVFGGFYTVPLYALIQNRSDPGHRSRIIAGNNILNALLMVASAAFAIGLGTAGLSVSHVLLATGLLNVVVAVYIYTLVPEFLIRFIVWLGIHSLYRLHTRGLEHIPEAGPALLVAEGGWREALLITAACPRPVRFAAPRHWLRLPIVGFVLRNGGAIPLDGARADTSLEDLLIGPLEAGALVCLLAPKPGDPAGGMDGLAALDPGIPLCKVTLHDAQGQPRVGRLPRLPTAVTLSVSPPMLRQHHRVPNASL